MKRAGLNTTGKLVSNAHLFRRACRIALWKSLLRGAPEAEISVAQSEQEPRHETHAKKRKSRFSRVLKNRDSVRLRDLCGLTPSGRAYRKPSRKLLIRLLKSL